MQSEYAKPDQKKIDLSIRWLDDVGHQIFKTKNGWVQMQDVINDSKQQQNDR